MLDRDKGEGNGAEASQRLGDYLDLPMFLLAVLFTLLAFVHWSGMAKGMWYEPLLVMQWLLWAVFVCEYSARLALTHQRVRYLRRHWLDLLVVLVPFLGFFRLIAALLPILRLALFGEWLVHSYGRILKQRKLGRLLLVSILVTFIAATLEFLFEAGTRGTTMHTYGDALWWAAATTTTVGNQLYPITPGGEVVAFLLMLYAPGVFSYVTSSIASVLIGGDAQQDPDVNETPASGAPPAQLDANLLSKEDIETLRSILDRAEAHRRHHGAS